MFVIDVRSDREICGHIELSNLRSLNREREMPVSRLEKGGRRDNAWREKWHYLESLTKKSFFIRCHSQERRIREQLSVYVHLEVNNWICVPYLVLFNLDIY